MAGILFFAPDRLLKKRQRGCVFDFMLLGLAVKISVRWLCACISAGPYILSRPFFVVVKRQAWFCHAVRKAVVANYWMIA
jgi:hypothetical protein